MAMTKCKECGNEVSDQARVCPHCGIDLVDVPQGNEKEGGGCGCFTFLCFLFLVSLVGMGYEKYQDYMMTPEEKTEKQEQRKKQAIKDEAEKRVAAIEAQGIIRRAGYKCPGPVKIFPFTNTISVFCGDKNSQPGYAIQYDLEKDNHRDGWIVRPK